MLMMTTTTTTTTSTMMMIDDDDDDDNDDIVNSDRGTKFRNRTTGMTPTLPAFFSQFRFVCSFCLVPRVFPVLVRALCGG